MTEGLEISPVEECFRFEGESVEENSKGRGEEQTGVEWL